MRVWNLACAAGPAIHRRRKGEKNPQKQAGEQWRPDSEAGSTDIDGTAAGPHRMPDRKPEDLTEQERQAWQESHPSQALLVPPLQPELRRLSRLSARAQSTGSCDPQTSSA